MALINCPECGKEISNKASACVNCGCPITPADINTSNDNEPFPELPSNLGIGSQIVNWGGDAYIPANYQGTENFKSISNGDCAIYLHQYGIRISQAFNEIKINRAQIVDIFSYKDNYLTNGNVIGNAIVGGILFGGVGAVVGGMSGVQKQATGTFLAITYWDTKLKQKVTVSFLAKRDVTKFINRAKKELLEIPENMKQYNPSVEDDEKQTKKEVKGCAIAIGIFAAIVVLLIIIIECTS